MIDKKKEDRTEFIVVDPFGSYTGKPLDPQERPVQDADDLQFYPPGYMPGGDTIYPEICVLQPFLRVYDALACLFQALF